MTLQALRQRIGDEKFFNTLRAYHSTFKGSVAETQDFVAIAQRESGQDLRDFFKQWLYTPGKPAEPYCYCASTPGNVGGTVPATLALTLGTPRDVRAVHAGRGEGVHGVHDRHRHLDRGRREAVRHRTRAT